jgi:surface protein
MKFNNETLSAAVKEWLDDESKAEKKYGHISDWDTSEVTDMSTMFSAAKSFNQPLEKWDVSQVTDMTGMFKGATSFNQPLEKWDVSNVTTMLGMFLTPTI